MAIQIALDQVWGNSLHLIVCRPPLAALAALKRIRLGLLVNDIHASEPDFTGRLVPCDPSRATGKFSTHLCLNHSLGFEQVLLGNTIRDGFHVG